MNASPADSYTRSLHPHALLPGSRVEGMVKTGNMMLFGGGWRGVANLSWGVEDIK